MPPLNAYDIERLAMKNGTKPPVEKKKHQPIPKMSAKRKVEQREYVKIVKAAAKVDERCKVKSPVCTGEMQGMNHSQKRSPANLLSKENLTPSCNSCNNFIENNLVWAKNNGHFISRFKK